MLLAFLRQTDAVLLSSETAFSSGILHRSKLWRQVRTFWWIALLTRMPARKATSVFGLDDATPCLATIVQHCHCSAGLRVSRWRCSRRFSATQCQDREWSRLARRSRFAAFGMVMRWLAGKQCRCTQKNLFTATSGWRRHGKAATKIAGGRSHLRWVLYQATVLHTTCGLRMANKSANSTPVNVYQITCRPARFARRAASIITEAGYGHFGHNTGHVIC